MQPQHVMSLSAAISEHSVVLHSFSPHDFLVTGALVAVAIFQFF